MWRGLGPIWLCVACRAQLAGDLPATSGGDDIDGGSATTSGGSAAGSGDGGASCARGRVVYLNFDGQALTKADTSDATLDRASWMIRSTGTVPRYHDGEADRDTDITTITDGIRQQLAVVPVTAVTSRPASGPYVMIVFGGNATQIGSAYNTAVNELDCSDLVINDVAWIADGAGSAQRVINLAVGAIGFGIGLTATTSPSDCMCSWTNHCNATANAPCTLSPSITRDPTADKQCPGLTTQDEPATFAQAFCQ